VHSGGKFVIKRILFGGAEERCPSFGALPFLVVATSTAFFFFFGTAMFFFGLTKERKCEK